MPASPDLPSNHLGRRILRRTISILVFLAIITGVVWVLLDELSTSRIQAYFLSRFDEKIGFDLAPGADKALQAPPGPYDERLAGRDRSLWEGRSPWSPRTALP